MVNSGVTLNIKSPYVLEAGAEIELISKVTPKQDQLGYFHAEIVVQTNHPDQAMFDVRVYGEVKALAQSPAFAPGAGGSK